MKNLSLALVLVLTAGQCLAFGNNRLPRLATVHIKHFAAPGSVLLLNRSIALMSTKAQEETNFHKLYRQRLRNSVIMTAVSVMVLSGITTQALLSVPSKLFDDFLFSILATGGIILSGLLSVRGVTGILELHTVEEKLNIIAKIEKSENNIVIHSDSNNQQHIGILAHAGEKLFVVDAQGNKQAIDPEKFMQFVAIRDGLPPGSLSNWLFRNKPMSTPISAHYANDYLDATLAFTYKGKNHLGTISDISFAPDGQGVLKVVTSSGAELVITSGKRGQPVVVDTNTGNKVKGKFRGVLFLP